MKKARFFILISAALLSVPLFANAQTIQPGTPRVLAVQDEQLTNQKFAFTYGDKVFNVPTTLLEQWHEPVSFISNNSLTSEPANPDNLLARLLGENEAPSPFRVVTYDYDPGQIYNFLRATALEIEKETTEPKLVIEGNRATSFTPPRDGIKVDFYKTLRAALSDLESRATSTAISTSTTSPQTKLGSLNNLGITELVAQGTSNFKGSPKNRIHNIEVGVEKMKGIIVGPNEEFSFNKYLGPVDGEHGFLPELVIKASGTVPEFGGGLCQVSSTVFRGAMQAGLPITQRRNHAYAVQYYAPQGTDATIYPGVIDLKFINDTGSSILIWPEFTDRYTLVFNLYGTKDSRQVVLGKPYQYDKKPDGSMKATWEREVIKDGQSKKDVFKSVYASPALYHKTEEFAKPTSTPVTQ